MHCLWSVIFSSPALAIRLCLFYGPGVILMHGQKLYKIF